MKKYNQWKQYLAILFNYYVVMIYNGKMIKKDDIF